jgi:hypothetical protein
MTTTVPQEALEKRAQAGIVAPRRIDPELMQRRTPEHVAPMVVYLCSEEAWNINGQTFFVSGGEVSLLQEPMPYRTIATDGIWDLSMLRRLVPEFLMQGIRNPAPPAEENIPPSQRPAKTS